MSETVNSTPSPTPSPAVHTEHFGESDSLVLSYECRSDTPTVVLTNTRNQYQWVDPTTHPLEWEANFPLNQAFSALGRAPNNLSSKSFPVPTEGELTVYWANRLDYYTIGWDDDTCGTPTPTTTTTTSTLPPTTTTTPSTPSTTTTQPPTTPPSLPATGPGEFIFVLVALAIVLIVFGQALLRKVKVK